MQYKQKKKGQKTNDTLHLNKKTKGDIQGPLSSTFKFKWITAQNVLNLTLLPAYEPINQSIFTVQSVMRLETILNVKIRWKFYPKVGPQYLGRFSIIGAVLTSKQWTNICTM